MPPDPPSMVCCVLRMLCTSQTIVLLLQQFLLRWIQCAIHYVLQPHIYDVLQYTLKLAPPPENPRSAPGMLYWLALLPTGKESYCVHYTVKQIWFWKAAVNNSTVD